MENHKNLQTKIIKELKRLNLIQFTVNDVYKLINKNKNQIYQIILSLKKKGWIKDIEKGKYVLLGFDQIGKLHPFFIASHIITPSYVSFYSALQFYGFTEQMPRTIFLATLKSKKPLEKPYNIVFVKLDKKRFFGYKKIFINEQEIFIAEKEKCIIDCLFQLRYSGGITEVYNALEEKLDIDKLLEYAVLMDSKTLLKRLGYLLEINKIDVYNKIKDYLGKGYTLLDPFLEKKGKLNHKWLLIINRINLQ